MYKNLKIKIIDFILLEKNINSNLFIFKVNSIKNYYDKKIKVI